MTDFIPYVGYSARVRRTGGILFENDSSALKRTAFMTYHVLSSSAIILALIITPCVYLIK